MHLLAESIPLVAVFWPGGWELVLLLAIILLLFGSKHLPPAIGRFRDALDQGSVDAGRSVGGIYGKRAAEALTPDNQTGELYRPAAFDKPQPPRRSIRNFVRRITCFLRNLLRRIFF